MTCYKTHHPNVDVGRLYITRSDGSKGVIQFELTFKKKQKKNNKWF